jgi:hypothetical protein
MVLTGMLVLGLAACSSVAAKEPARDDGIGTLVAGTLIEVTVQGSHSWRRSPLGEALTATVTADVTNAGRWVVIPAGSAVGLRVAHWRRATRTSQADARITFEVFSVTVRRRWYPVRAMVEMTPVAVRPSGEVAAVASGTRIRFVLSEMFTAARRPGGMP